MVASPGDLYEIMENSRRDITTVDGLGNFAERADEQNHPAVNPPEKTFGNPLPVMRMRLENSSSALPDAPDFLKGAGLAAGAVLVASLGDKKAEQFFKNHAGSRLVRGWDKVGKAAPFVAIGAAGMAMAMGDDRIAKYRPHLVGVCCCRSGREHRAEIRRWSRPTGRRAWRLGARVQSQQFIVPIGSCCGDFCRSHSFRKSIRCAVAVRCRSSRFDGPRGRQGALGFRRRGRWRIGLCDR